MQFFMRKISLLFFMCFCFIAASNKKTSAVDGRTRAKQVADSVIYSHVPKNTFLKFYRFDAVYSSVYFKNTNNIAGWLSTLKAKPSEYYINYILMNNPTNMFDHFAGVVLDSNYRLIELNELIDTAYLKLFISEKKLKALIGNKNTMWNMLIFDSIPNKITVQPFIELRQWVRTIDSAGRGVLPCLWNVDTCFKLNPYTGKTITSYTKDMSQCL